MRPLLLALALAACSTAAPPKSAPIQWKVESSDVTANGRMAPQTGCGEDSRTPALSWPPAPDGTASHAVIVSVHTGTSESVHWTAWDIGPDRSGLHGGIRATQSPPLQGLTSAGTVGWTPLCDLPSDARVTIEVAALSELLPPPPTFTAAALRARMAPHVLALGRLEALPPLPPPSEP